jgi:hypothetical protein
VIARVSCTRAGPFVIARVRKAGSFVIASVLGVRVAFSRE